MTQDIEEFWADLLPFLDAGEVIPVVGQDLLTVDRDGEDVSLYRLVAEQSRVFGVGPS